MQQLYLGKVVNTHGIKGEIRIISNFAFKDKVFVKDFPIYIGENRKKEYINTYRIHKNYDMITLRGTNDINEVLKYKGKKVYIEKCDLKLKNNEYVIDELIGFKVMCDNKEYGIIKDIYDNNGNTLLNIDYTKEYYIPYRSNYINGVDLNKKEIYTTNVEELIL